VEFPNHMIDTVSGPVITFCPQIPLGQMTSWPRPFLAFIVRLLGRAGGDLKVGLLGWVRVCWPRKVLYHTFYTFN
jgi:hypothetical protein